VRGRAGVEEDEAFRHGVSCTSYGGPWWQGGGCRRYGVAGGAVRLCQPGDEKVRRPGKFNEYQTPAMRGEINGPFEICPKVASRVLTNSIGIKLTLIPAGSS